MERVRPKRGLNAIQDDIGYTNGQLGPLKVTDGMHRGQRGTQFPCIDQCVPTALLKAGLCFDHTLLDGLHLVASRQCAP